MKGNNNPRNLKHPHDVEPPDHEDRSEANSSEDSLEEDPEPDEGEPTQRLVVVAEIEAKSPEAARQMLDSLRDYLSGNTVLGREVTLYQPSGRELRQEGFVLPEPTGDHEKVTLSPTENE